MPASATQLQAACSFSGPDGDFEKGELFALEDQTRIDFLTNGGYAKRVTPAEVEAIVAATPAPQPETPEAATASDE